MQYVYLIKVDINENNNKYYEMQENSDGTFTATYGRVNHTAQTKKYPINKWDSMYWQKLKKGYRDVTEYHALKTDSNKVVSSINHEAPIVVNVFKELRNAANISFSKNYSVTSIGAVTPVMIDDSQDKLNVLADRLDSGQWSQFNNTLNELFHIIPRRMDGKVKDYILDLSNPTETSAQNLLTNEQDLLNMVRGQVQVSKNDAQGDFFEQLNLKVDIPTSEEITMIRQKLGEIGQQYHSAIKVAHLPSLTRFQDNIARMPLNADLQWHGSRNENWLSILTTGLVLYPTSAKITGKMFGYGLYFAPKARKSAGYTSLSGSYWANGDSRFGYLALFHLNRGRMLETKRHESWHNKVTAEILSRKGYDSLYAYGGADLRNDEMIVYQEPQATVGYLVRISV